MSAAPHLRAVDGGRIVDTQLGAGDLCECGCGERASTKRGQSRRFVSGHNRRRPLVERLAAKTRPAHDLSPNGMAGCLLWTGARNEKGYGTIGVEGQRHRRVHRVAYELAGLTIPNGLELDHVCRRRHCVNPEHLEPVTHSENLRRAVRKLTPEAKREVAELMASGRRWQDVAAAYGISQTHVYRVARTYA